MTTGSTALPGTNPATYSKEIIEHIRSILPGLLDDYLKARGWNAPIDRLRLLDPFAGEGKIVQITDGIWPGSVEGIELEPEWAEVQSVVKQGDALNPHHLFSPGRFDFVITSPPYGTRMADDHNARDDSKRNTYRHRLGRALSSNSSANLQWDHPLMLYQMSMTFAYMRLRVMLKQGGIFILNCSDHIRNHKRIRSAQWHKVACMAMGYELLAEYNVKTRRNRQGANHEKRVAHEKVYVFSNDKFADWRVDKYQVREW